MLWIISAGSGCQVEILPERTSNDGYGRLSDRERSSILPVGLAVSPDCEEQSAPGDSVQLSDWCAVDVMDEVSRHPYTWLLFGAGWCPHSQQALRLLSTTDTLLEKLKIHPVALYRTYDLHYLKRKRTEYGIRFQVGFISNSAYGDAEEEKQRKFLEELTGAEGSTCVPYNLLVDRRGSVLARKCGPVNDVREFLRLALQEE